MDRRNLRILSIVMVLSFLFLAGCSSPEERKAEFFKRGKEYVEKNKLKSAVIEFKNAIQIDPKFGPAHYQLALCDIKLGRFHEALSELRKSVDVDPDNRDARIRLIQFLILAKQNQEAEKHIEYLLNKNGSDVEALILKSTLDMKNAKMDQAIKTLEKANEADPQNAKVYLALANAFASKKEFSQAEDALKKAISFSKTPREKMQAELMLASLYEVNGRVEEAKNVLSEAIKDNPDKLVPMISLAKFYLRQGQADAARSILDKAIKAFPKKALPLAMKADLAIRGNRLSEAEKLLESAHEIAPKNANITAKLALIKLNLNKKDEAKKLSGQVLKNNPSIPLALLVKGRIALMDRDFDSAIKCFEQVLQKASKDSQTLYFRALAYLGKGKIKDAEDDLVSCTAQAPNFLKARLLLADLYIRERRADDSLYQSEYILKRVKDEPLALIFHASALMLKRDFKAAASDLKKVIEKEPGNLRARYLLANVELGLGDKARAEEILKALIAQQPDYLSAVVTLTAIYMKEKRPEQALALCQELEKKVPKDPAILLVKGRVLMAMKRFDEAEKVFKKALSLNENLVEPYVALAKIYVSTGKADKAIHEYERLLKKKPDLVMAYMAIGSIQQKLGRVDKAETAYRDALKVKPNFAPAANNLAWLLTDKNQLDEAFIYIQKAKESAPEQPSILDTSGWILAKRGNFDLAVADLSQALKKWPNQPTINYHMAVALKGLGKKKLAIEHLKKALESKGPFPERKEAEKLFQELS